MYTKLGKKVFCTLKEFVRCANFFSYWLYETVAFNFKSLKVMYIVNWLYGDKNYSLIWQVIYLAVLRGSKFGDQAQLTAKHLRFAFSHKLYCTQLVGYVLYWLRNCRPSSSFFFIDMTPVIHTQMLLFSTLLLGFYMNPRVIRTLTAV